MYENYSLLSVRMFVLIESELIAQNFDFDGQMLITH